MALRYKISLLATIAVLIVLIPFSWIYIRALAQAEEEEIKGRLRAIGELMKIELSTIELGAESAGRQLFFLQAAQKIDTAILFAAIYQEERIDIPILNRKRLSKELAGSDSEVVQQLVE